MTLWSGPYDLVGQEWTELWHQFSLKIDLDPTDPRWVQTSLLYKSAQKQAVDLCEQRVYNATGYWTIRHSCSFSSRPTKLKVCCNDAVFY